MEFLKKQFHILVAWYGIKPFCRAHVKFFLKKKKRRQELKFRVTPFDWLFSLHSGDFANVYGPFSKLEHSVTYAIFE